MRYHPLRHLGLKIMAVALATLLWLIVAGDHLVERSMRVPLEFRNIPEALEIVGDPPTAVDVRLRGSSALLGRLESRDIVAVLDLTNARPGSRMFHLQSEDVRAPYGVEVAQVAPGTLAVDLETSGRRTVPIVPALDGEPAPGFVIGRVTSDPPTVEVVGPDSRLKQLTDATVTVEVLPAPVERDLSGVPVRWRNLGTGLLALVRPTLTRVTARGRREALADLRAGNIDAFVDLAGLGPGRYNLRVQVDPSQTFGVSAIEPAVVDVTIK